MKQIGIRFSPSETATIWYESKFYQIITLINTIRLISRGALKLEHLNAYENT